MTDHFNRTVDLTRKIINKRINKASQVNQNKEAKLTKNKLHTINRPVIKKVNEEFVRRLVLLLAFLIMIFVGYFMLFKKNEEKNGWYSIRLVNDEIFYGKIIDIESDPVVMTSVYYDYDKVKDNKKVGEKYNQEKIDENGGLRLVKRGKEIHGPEGMINIVRSQILYMELLKSDSKVLNAIMQYEK